MRSTLRNMKDEPSRGSGGTPPRKILKIKGFKTEDLQVMSNYLPVDYMYSQFNNKYFVKFVNTYNALTINFNNS